MNVGYALSPVSRAVAIKNMASGEQRSVTRNALVDELRQQTT